MQKKILLIHTSNKLLHYRVSIYNYFYEEFKKSGYDLWIVTNYLQNDNPHEIKFNLRIIDDNIYDFIKIYKTILPDILITFCSLKDYFTFPIIFLHKLRKQKLIYWGHGINLNKPNTNRLFFNYWHGISDAIILYSKNEKQYIKGKYHSKVFIANNTLNLKDLDYNYENDIVDKLNVETNFNVVFVGRIEKRKKTDNLLKAFKYFNTEIGLVIIGEDLSNLLPSKLPQRVYYLGPLYGNELHSVLNKTDVFCLPGHVGLSIVDAFYHGLPLITENGKHAPEICYLKNGHNGYIVPEDDIISLAGQINKLFADKNLLSKMSINAKSTIQEEGSIVRMFNSFLEACNN